MILLHSPAVDPLDQQSIRHPCANTKTNTTRLHNRVDPRPQARISLIQRHAMSVCLINLDSYASMLPDFPNERAKLTRLHHQTDPPPPKRHPQHPEKSYQRRPALCSCASKRKKSTNTMIRVALVSLPPLPPLALAAALPLLQVQVEVEVAARPVLLLALGVPPQRPVEPTP